jgi:pyridoxal phosphate enzyme (YggS family)
MSLPTNLTERISAQLGETQAAIATALEAANRSDTVRLLAVSKTQAAEAVLAAAHAGQTSFGENYVQEGVNKILACRAAGYISERALTWHLIGPLQSNKTRLVAELFDWVESVDRLKIAERLSEQRPASLPPLQICVQVNISGESSKSGCSPTEAAVLCIELAKLPKLQLRGLMSIPEPIEGQTAQRAACRPLRELFDRIKPTLPNPDSFDTLSIGMSHDLAAAIAEGATQVRIGTAIFGQRTLKTTE